jgi:hypothetical protein
VAAGHSEADSCVSVHAQQDLDESTAYWAGEVDGGRVRVRRKKRSVDDPWLFTPCAPDTVLEKGMAFSIPALTGPQLFSTACICCAGDSLEVMRHAHERVVAGGVPAVLQETPLVYVVHKPAGVPCTANDGGVNNVVSIASASLFGGRPLHPCHRLDLPVSGILLLAKTGRAQRRVLEAMTRKDKVTKVGHGLRCCASVCARGCG